MINLTQLDYKWENNQTINIVAKVKRNVNKKKKSNQQPTNEQK